MSTPFHVRTRHRSYADVDKDVTATLCDGVDEYRSYCNRARTQKDVSDIILSVEKRFIFCL